MDDLDAAAESLQRVRVRVYGVLVACSVFLEKRAEEGDVEAQVLAELVDEAFMAMRAERVYAESVVAEHLSGRL